VEKEWAENTFKIIPSVDEDIHTANERRLGEIIGKVGMVRNFQRDLILTYGRMLLESYTLDAAGMSRSQRTCDYGLM
jgi:argininosuccinate lyase